MFFDTWRNGVLFCLGASLAATSLWSSPEALENDIIAKHHHSRSRHHSSCPPVPVVIDLHASTSRFSTSTATIAEGDPMPFDTSFVADDNITYASGVFTIANNGRYQIAVAFDGSATDEFTPTGLLQVNRNGFPIYQVTIGYSNTSGNFPLTAMILDLDLLNGDQVELLNVTGEVMTLVRDNAGRSTWIEMNRIGVSP